MDWKCQATGHEARMGCDGLISREVGKTSKTRDQSLLLGLEKGAGHLDFLTGQQLSLERVEGWKVRFFAPQKTGFPVQWWNEPNRLVQTLLLWKRNCTGDVLDASFSKLHLGWFHEVRNHNHLLGRTYRKKSGVWNPINSMTPPFQQMSEIQDHQDVFATMMASSVKPLVMGCGHVWGIGCSANLL